MNIWDPRRVIGLSIVAAALWACGDDDKGAGPNDSTAGRGGSSSAGRPSSAAGKANSAGSSGSGASIDAGGEGGIGGGAGSIDDGGEAGQVGVSGGNGGGSGGASGGSSGASGGSGGNSAGSGGGGSLYPTVPPSIAFSGCTGVGPICSVTQDNEKLSLKCGTRIFTGTIQSSGNYTLTGTPLTSGTTTVTTTNTTCTGQVRPSGVTGTCENTVSPPPASGSATTSCTLSATRPLPGISCLELPSKFSNFEFDAKNLGECTTIQNNCNFQANCADGVVVGTATKTGASFSYTLTAKAAAAAPEGTTPAFAQGAQVSHSCATTLTGGALQGTCSAGAYTRSPAIPATSVYAFEAKAPTSVPVCSAIGPFSEHLFVLDSCPLLKDGEGTEPGIGEPICSFQQNGCIWKVTCVSDPAKPLVFSGKLTPGQTSVSWRLETGTPCEAGFDAKGNLSGKCTVPGAAACNLSSKAPAPAVGCPKLATKFSSLGCGNDSDGVPLDCRKSLQHGCNFAAICDFNTTRFPDSLFAGKTSTENGVDYLKFPGLSGRSCTVQKATAAEIADPANCRAAGEWYGDCLTPTGGGCANTFQCVADVNGVYPKPSSNIRRGLRLWFE